MTLMYGPVNGEDPASGSHSDALYGMLSMFSDHGKHANIIRII